MLNVNLHRQTMLRLLKDIYSDPALSSNLGFKGGTAIYLLYGLPRFSVDLDFDLLNPNVETAVFKKVSDLLAKYGRIDQATKKHYTLFYLLSYQTSLQKLKVEISRRPSDSSYEEKSHLGIPLFVMTKPDMFAHKLVALTERRQIANRDLFDIHFFLKENWPINIKIVENRTKLSYPKYLQKCLTTIKGKPSESLLANLGELIDNKTKFWVKNRLKPELISLLQIHLDSLQNS